jgi:hypothetical protein
MKLESINTHTSNFMKIHPVGVELFHANEETDKKKLIVVFHNFANMPKMGDKGQHAIFLLTHIFYFGKYLITILLCSLPASQ